MFLAPLCAKYTEQFPEAPERVENIKHAFHFQRESCNIKHAFHFPPIPSPLGRGGLTRPPHPTFAPFEATAGTSNKHPLVSSSNPTLEERLTQTLDVQSMHKADFDEHTWYPPVSTLSKRGGPETPVVPVQT